MGLYLLIPTLIIIVASVLIVRAGAIALKMTGMDEKTASFQALSAFTRAGFTTRESETVVSNPQRRRIISWLMILGNAGIVAVIVTATSSLATSLNYRLGIAIAVLIIGLYVIYRLAQHTGLTRRWESFVENRLIKGSFFSGAVQVEHLIHFIDGYGVARVPVRRYSPSVSNSLKGKLKADNFIILGIERQGQWINNPEASELINEGDYLILYGILGNIEGVFHASSRNQGL